LISIDVWSHTAEGMVSFPSGVCLGKQAPEVCSLPQCPDLSVDFMADVSSESPRCVHSFLQHLEGRPKQVSMASLPAIDGHTLLSGVWIPAVWRLLPWVPMSILGGCGCSFSLPFLYPLEFSVATS
jgi:hypothetical protein